MLTLDFNAAGKYSNENIDIWECNVFYFVIIFIWMGWNETRGEGYEYE